GYDCLLIGSKQPIRLDGSRLDMLFNNPEFRSDLKNLGMVDTPSLLRHYRMDTATLAQYTGEGPLNKDSFPVLEFECPKGLYGHSFTAYRDLAQAGSSPPDDSWVKGIAPGKLDTARVLQEAFHQLELAESVGRTLEKTNLERAENTRKLIGHLEKIQTSLATTNDEWLDRLATSVGFRATRTPGKTLQEYLMYYYLVIAQELQKTGNSADAARQVERAFAFAGETPEVPKNTARQLATACLQRKDHSGGISIMESALTRFPEDAGVVEFYGILHGAAGQDAKAESLLKRALQLAENNDLRGASIQHNLGFLYQQRGNLAAARESYEKALLLNPSHPGTRELLEALVTPAGN
ncbi:MAG: tetratricopeptide repeat protein, partial [Planctomycetes bacterium]|nr:tetratricopeptide repeat protein [Planctomycetota bacterium]